MRKPKYGDIICICDGTDECDVGVVREEGGIIFFDVIFTTVRTLGFSVIDIDVTHAEAAIPDTEEGLAFYASKLRGNRYEPKTEDTKTTVGDKTEPGSFAQKVWSGIKTSFKRKKQYS